MLAPGPPPVTENDAEVVSDGLARWLVDIIDVGEEKCGW